MAKSIQASLVLLHTATALLFGNNISRPGFGGVTQGREEKQLRLFVSLREKNHIALIKKTDFFKIDLKRYI